MWETRTRKCDIIAWHLTYQLSTFLGVHFLLINWSTVLALICLIWKVFTLFHVLLSGHRNPEKKTDLRLHLQAQQCVYHYLTQLPISRGQLKIEHPQRVHEKKAVLCKCRLINSSAAPVCYLKNVWIFHWIVN